MQLNLLVLRAHDPKGLAAFYAQFGLRFVAEKHGSGPVHMASDTGRAVLEIYPCSEKSAHTGGLRLGFAVAELDEHCRALAGGAGRLVRGPRMTQWGRCATIEDPEGHIIDLTELESTAR